MHPSNLLSGKRASSDVEGEISRIMGLEFARSSFNCLKVILIRKPQPTNSYGRFFDVASFGSHHFW